MLKFTEETIQYVVCEIAYRLRKATYILEKVYNNRYIDDEVQLMKKVEPFLLNEIKLDLEQLSILRTDSEECEKLARNLERMSYKIDYDGVMNENQELVNVSKYSELKIEEVCIYMTERVKRLMEKYDYIKTLVILETFYLLEGSIYGGFSSISYLFIPHGKVNLCGLCRKDKEKKEYTLLFFLNYEALNHASDVIAPFEKGLKRYEL